MSYDVLIIGSGAAGLSTALELSKLDPTSKIVVVSKERLKDSNTQYAQGGIACVIDKDPIGIKNHISDTLIAGDGLCDENIVTTIVEEASASITALMDSGMKFDNTSGKIDFSQEGGHSQKIVMHNKDSTGKELENTLLNQIKKHENITLLEHHFVRDLLTETVGKHTKCIGVSIIDKQDFKTFNIASKVTVLAAGGVGQIYKSTTNPPIATADGIAMASRANVKLKNMEFIQFHPTALYENYISPLVLISEAIRGNDAILLNDELKPFMKHYDHRKELASRDIVSRAIITEMSKLNSKHVWLDCTKIKDFKTRFPYIYSACKKRNMDPCENLIPVVPAAHYLCGGIEVSIEGKTNLQGLYACGENACTGMHGANRLASNSLLEAIVLSKNIAKSIITELTNTKENKVIPTSLKTKINSTLTINEEYINQCLKILQETMSSYVEIKLETNNLVQAQKIISCLYDEIRAYHVEGKLIIKVQELQNLITTSLIIINESLARKENKGTFYNEDLRKVNNLA